MEQDAIIPVDLGSYRREIETLSTKYAAALNRLVITKSALRAAVLAGISMGLSENEAAKLSGITRKTVREWQGK